MEVSVWSHTEKQGSSELSSLAQKYPGCEETKPEPGWGGGGLPRWDWSCQHQLAFVGLKWEIRDLVLPLPLNKGEPRQAAQSLFLILRMGMTSALRDVNKIARVQIPWKVCPLHTQRPFSRLSLCCMFFNP